jgi:uncharacterized protein YbjT (DUF2867 family)
MLLAEGKKVRVMTRTPEKLEAFRKQGAEVVQGDVRDPTSLKAACEGVEKVVSSVQALTGKGKNNPRTVDGEGNRNLIDAAKAAGVAHFVLVSALGARADHPLEFFRMKFAAEEYLRASGLTYTILHPGAFMEFWATLVGQPILDKGATTIFGKGQNPVNFVSVEDVARMTLLALESPAAKNRVIEIGGPQNLTLVQVAETYERLSGKQAKRSHVPLPVMRVMTVLMRPLNPAMSRQIGAGINMDTTDQTIEMGATLKEFPLRLTTLEEVIRKNL